VRSIMNQTGHRSVQMVRRYIREGSLFREKWDSLEGEGPETVWRCSPRAGDRTKPAYTTSVRVQRFRGRLSEVL